VNEGKAKAGAAGAALLVVVAAIGWLDYRTGPDIGFSLFYLIPIAGAGWFLGRFVAATLAMAAAASWFLAELAWKDAAGAVVHWNGFTRLVTYLAIAMLLAVVRKDRDRLAALNAKLSVALGAESRLARTDRLTSLGNSRNFFEHLSLDLMARRSPVCVAMLDIDNFKRINDGHGHHAGDELLRRIASEIAAEIRGTDVVARMGGDEFAILFRGVEPEGASKIAARIVERVRLAAAPYPGADISASIGIAWFSDPPRNADDVLRIADAAMYQAKSDGKGRVRVVFDSTPASAT
jgi:diguanylate cyclase (GGDEF)-like protein